jgi:sugar phosphate isomerase/epimerase
MNQNQQPPIAVSTWSVHRLLGYAFANGPGSEEPFARSTPWGAGEISFEEFPAALKQQGFNRVEICHFHLRSFEPNYLRTVGDAFRAQGITIQTLLIDDGDVTNPVTRERDLAWIARLVSAAASLGAENARVIAGKSSPSPEALALSVSALKHMVALGQSVGVRIVTENWFDLLSTPREVFHVLDAVGNGLGFLADTGNWSGESKYQDLQAIFARAELCHAKADFDGSKINDTDFTRCMSAAHAAGYAGPMTLIYGEDHGGEWASLAAERKVVAQVYG